MYKLDVFDHFLRLESLHLVIQPSDDKARLALNQLGFKKVPDVAQLSYISAAEADLAHLFLQISQTLSDEAQRYSRFILTRSPLYPSSRKSRKPLTSPHYLVEFLNAQPLSELTLMMRHAWFLKVLTQEGLFFNFQPIVNLATGRLVGHECLARARSEAGHQFSGQQLIEAAMQMNMTHEFDTLARSACLEQLAQFCKHYSERCSEQNSEYSLQLQTKFFINVLPNAIARDPEALEENFKQVLALGLRPEQIVFELTEVEAIGDHPHLPEIIQRIRDHGFGLALDDLCSNVAIDHYCTEFRPDVIKLDRRLIHGCSRYALKQVMIKSLLQFAHELDILVLAEGLEAPADIEYCKSIGIDLGQGYGVGTPTIAPWERVNLEERVAC